LEIALPCDTVESMPRLPFITFEGTEGCGKSTQVLLLAGRLEKLGIPFVLTREPGGTPIGETIRELLQFSPDGTGMAPETELLLFEASRSQLVRETIKPALTAGLCVISDRFLDSTTVYQGAARKLDPELVQKLNALAVGDCIPDVTFVLDVDADTARARLEKPRRPDRMEMEPAEFYEQVRHAYRELAKHDPARVVLVDGNESADKVENVIWTILTSRFAVLDINPQSAVRNRQS
jgi:dTMP kinase